MYMHIHPYRYMIYVLTYICLFICAQNLALSQTGKQGTEESSATGLPVSAPDEQTNSVGGHVPQKAKLIREQLVLLLHARKCSQREEENPAHTCNVQHCRTMKDLLRHMMKCQKSNNCSCERFLSPCSVYAIVSYTCVHLYTVVVQCIPACVCVYMSLL